MSGVLALAIRHLFACGASNEAVVKFVEEVEALKKAELSAGAARTRRWRHKASQSVTSVTCDAKESTKENIYINNISRKGGMGENQTSQVTLDANFEAFWASFPRKIGKGAARKAYKNALKRGSAEEILTGAKRYKPKDLEYCKHPSTWLNADCWLDEPDKPISSTVLAGPWKPVEREPIKDISEEERQANLEKLAKIRFRGKGIDVENG